MTKKQIEELKKARLAEFEQGGNTEIQKMVKFLKEYVDSMNAAGFTTEQALDLYKVMLMRGK